MPKWRPGLQRLQWDELPQGWKRLWHSAEGGWEGRSTACEARQSESQGLCNDDYQLQQVATLVIMTIELWWTDNSNQAKKTDVAVTKVTLRNLNQRSQRWRKRPAWHPKPPDPSVVGSTSPKTMDLRLVVSRGLKRHLAQPHQEGLLLAISPTLEILGQPYSPRPKAHHTSATPSPKDYKFIGFSTWTEAEEMNSHFSAGCLEVRHRQPRDAAIEDHSQPGATES